MADKVEKNITFKLKGVRLSFVHVFEPQEMKNDDGKFRYVYNLNALIPKKINGQSNPMAVELLEIIKNTVKAGWPDGKTSIPQDRRCLRDGEPIDPDTADEEVPGSGTRKALYEGYEGHLFISANRSVKSKDAPNPVKIIGPRKTAKDKDGKPCFPRLTEADGLIYSGCYANVIVTIYPYDGSKDGNPNRINASLEAVQFVRHGEAFGAREVNVDEAFDEEDEVEGDDVLDEAGGKTAAPEVEDLGV